MTPSSISAPATFSDYRERVLAVDLDAVATPDQIPPDWLLARAGAVSAHYIPFDYVNPDARVVLVGISPGFVQWKNAVREAQRRLRMGEDDATVLRAAKYLGAFSGAIRPNLVALLDHVGLQRWLAIRSCASLFHEDARLMHVCGVLRQPIFVDGRNYNGASPNMLTHPLLRQQIIDYFACEAAQMRGAVFVPLGPKVGLALDWLARRGIIDEGRILHGLPHPSGANAERVAYFLGRKEKTALSSRTNGDQIDADRSRLLARMAALDPLRQAAVPLVCRAPDIDNFD